MATIDDINAQKKAAVATLDQKIYDGIAQKNAGGLAAGQADQLDHGIHELMVQRQAVYLQAYIGALTSAEMTKALGALSAATTEMNTAAAQMTTATSFITNVAALGSAAGKVATALKGSAG